MIFTKEIENTPEEIVLSMEDAELALMDAEFDLAMEDFNMYRASYDAEILAIEAYVKADKNLELCTESFNVIKEGFVDKAKEIGNRAWETLKKLFQALTNKAKALSKWISQIKLPTVINKTIWKEAYDVDELDNRINKIVDFIGSLSRPINDILLDKRKTDEVTEILNEDAKAWSYKVILDACKVKPPFGADANNANEFYSALDDYLEGSRKDQSVTFRDPKKEIDKRLKKCQKIITALEKSLNAMRIINFENINTEKRNTFNAVIDSYKVLYQIIDRCTNKVHRVAASWTRFKDDGKEEK